MKVNHINYPDDNNQIYCKQKDSIITLDSKGKFWRTCMNCKFFNGTYQGNGVECLYEDKPPQGMAAYYDNAQLAYNEQKSGK